MLMHVIGKPNDISIIVEVDRPDMSTDEILDRALAEFSEGYEIEWLIKDCVVIKEARSFTISGEKHTTVHTPDKAYCVFEEDGTTSAGVLGKHCEHIEYSGRTRGESHDA